ncbi:unnamed protein product [Ectocarpus sp. CCAP 1310/34]|nr:unnamed protein product [Ectocarpus sp. CCAP 1310/34]
MVEAAHLSSDSPLFVPPFSLPPEDRLFLLPHDEFMAYQRLNEMWCDGLAGKIAEAEAREQPKREDAGRLADGRLLWLLRRGSRRRSVRLFGLLRRGSRRRSVRLLWLLRRGSRRRSVRLFWRSERRISKRLGRSGGRSDRG